MSKLIPFPPQKSCTRCLHGTVLVDETHCEKFDEPVDSEVFAAENCDEYEPV